MARRLRGEGLSVAEVARQVSCAPATVRVVVNATRTRSGRRDDWTPGPGRLTVAEREEISLGLDRDETFSVIAGRLGRAVSTVSREVAAHGGRCRYRAWRRSGGRSSGPDDPNRPSWPCRLAAVVSEWLLQWWSPLAIARRLRQEFPDDPMMWVSHETIYQSLFVQGRGELRRELTRCLRSGRTQRRPQGRPGPSGRIPGMVMISDRPAEVADRAVPGHWEGDLVVGKNNKSAVGTLVERTSRYMLLLHLPDGHDAARVDAAMRRAVTKLPGQFFRTITWDQGREMARHAAFTVDTGIQIYFCDPHSPWQRPTNENTNGILRQYLPKGTDLSPYSEADLERIARSINNRPRGVLGYLKPSERLSQLLAHTA